MRPLGAPMTIAASNSADFVDRLSFEGPLGQKLLTSQRAYVLGMGPSLNKFDLGLLEHELVFGVNHAAGVGIRHDLLFIADDRRLVPELRAGAVPIVTIDACLEGNKEFFDNVPCYGDIKAVHYAEKNPAILDVAAYPQGLPVAYWTGSVITDLVVPFTVECGISELICLGLDGVDGSFPVTHAWGMDSLTRQLQDLSASNDAEVLPTQGTVAHLQEKAVRLAADRGTIVLNATPGGVTEAVKRVDPRTVGPVGVWRSGINSAGVDGSFISIGTSIFELQAASENQVELQHVASDYGRGSNRELDRATCRVEVGFIGDPHFSLLEQSGDRYLTTRSGFDRFAWRTPMQSFNSTLSSFPRGMTRLEAEEYAALISGLAEAWDRRLTVGDRLASMYVQREYA